jgi:adenylate kinase
MTDFAKPTRRIITISGMPCAGKDTAGDFLQSLIPRSVVISTGDGIRQAQDPRHPLHEKLQSYQKLLDQGQLFPSEAVINLEDPLNSVFPFMVEQALSDGATTIISTGFPRNYEQAMEMLKYFDMRLPEQKLQMDYVFLDVLPENIEARMIKRTAQRLAKGLPPRSDDNLETLPKRLRTYEEQTVPIILGFGENVIRIDANRPEEIVNQDVLEALESRYPLGIPRISGESTHRPGGERG